MAYVHSKYEVMIPSPGVPVPLDALADVANWAPGMMPHYIRAVALINLNAVGAAGVLKFDKRPTAGSDSSRGDGDVAVLTIPSGLAAGAVLYKDGLNVKISPGEEVVAQVTDVTAAGDECYLVLYVEPSWELPANNSDMTETA